jgi:hypothetical protein
MSNLTSLDYFERGSHEFVELCFSRGVANQFIYRVEVQIDNAHFWEHYDSLDGELNKRLAQEKFDEFLDRLSTPKVRV